MKSSFMLYVDQYGPIKTLTLEQKGLLLEAFFRFHAGEAMVFDDPVLAMAFSFFRQTFERDAEKYALKCRKNRENGLKSRAGSADGGDGKPSQTSAADTDTDTDSDTDTDREEKYISSASPPQEASRDAACARSSRRNSPAGEKEGKETQTAGYLTKKKRRLSGKRLRSFERFWTAFNYSRGKAEAADAWLDIPDLSDTLEETIIAAAEREASARQALLVLGRSPKWAFGWLAGRRWEDGGETAVVPEKTLEDLLAEKGISL